MTDLSNTKNKKEEQDDTIGPRIRHPSGSVHLDIIYHKEEKDKTKLSSVARFYQDIIRYSLAQDGPNQQSFKITDIGYWLLTHNPDYINFYKKSSDAKKSNRSKLNGITNRVKRYLNNLEEWGLIRKLGMVEVDTHNGLKTWLYGYTPLGYIIAWMLVYDNNPKKRDMAKCEIYKSIQDLCKLYKSYMTDLLAKIYEKFIEYDNSANNNNNNSHAGFFDTVINNLIEALKGENNNLPHYSNAVEYLSYALDLVLRNGKTRVKAQELYRKALDELPEDICRNVIRSEKTIIENNGFLLYQPPKIWEKAWQDNINNYDKIVLYGVCQNKECLRQYPVIISYYDYRYYQSISPYNYLQADCNICKTKGSLNVYYTLENLRL